MKDIEKLLKAMECSIKPCKERDDCAECEYRVLERVNDDFPCPPDVWEDGIGYWESCDCDEIVRDAIKTIRELQENQFLGIKTSNGIYVTLTEVRRMLLDFHRERNDLLRQIPKWHLCSEELPQLNKTVIVAYQVCGYTYYSISERYEEDKWSAIGGRKPTAWMELPKFDFKE